MTQKRASWGVKTWRRATDTLVSIGLGALFLAFLFYLIDGSAPIEDRYLIVGAAIMIGAIAVGGGRVYLRRKSDVLSDVLGVATEVVHLGPSRSDLRVTAVVLLFVSFGLGFIAFGGQTNTKLQILGWAGLILCSGLSVWMLTGNANAWLRLSPEGLEFSGFGVGPIAWSDIRRVKLQAVGRIQMIALELVNEESYLARKKKSRWRDLERFLFRSSFAFAPPTAQVKPEAMMAAIELRIKTFGRGSQ